MEKQKKETGVAGRAIEEEVDGEGKKNEIAARGGAAAAREEQEGGEVKGGGGDG